MAAFRSFCSFSRNKRTPLLKTKVSRDKFQSDVEAFLRCLTPMRVIVVGPLCLRQTVEVDVARAAIRNSVESISALTRCAFCDVSELKADLYQTDRVHLSPMGREAIARIFLPTASSVLGIHAMRFILVARQYAGALQVHVAANT